MASRPRLSIDEEFRQDNENQNTWGIQNAQANRMMTRVSRGQAANTPNSPRQRFQNESINQYRFPAVAANDNNPPTIRQKNSAPRIYKGPQENSDTDELTEREKNLQSRYYSDTQQQNSDVETTSSKKVIVDLATANTATAWRIITNSWAMTFCGVIQFWAGLVSSLFFGFTAAITYSYIGDVVTAVATFAGFSEPNLVAIGFWGLIMAGSIGWMSLLAASFHAHLWGLYPINGRGGSVKTGTLLLALVLYCLPLLNMFPWICIWTWTVKIYPK